MSRSKRRGRKEPGANEGRAQTQEPNAHSTPQGGQSSPRTPAPELVDEIAKAAQRGDMEQVETLLISATYSGPIPPPALLKAYEAIVPGSADRIMRWAENQTAHRQRRESEDGQAEIKAFARGQHYALVLGILIIAGAVACAWLGHPAVSGFLSLAGFGAIGAPAVINLIRQRATHQGGRSN